MAWSKSGSVRFFTAQAVGFVIEDFVQWVWALAFGAEKGKGREEVKMWKKVVGFSWVAVFMLFWSSPAWVFPNTVGNTGAVEGKMLPFSVIAFLMKRFM